METPTYRVTDNPLPLAFQLALDDSCGGQIPWLLSMTSVSYAPRSQYDRDLCCLERRQIRRLHV